MECGIGLPGCIYFRPSGHHKAMLLIKPKGRFISLADIDAVVTLLDSKGDELPTYSSSRGLWSHKEYLNALRLVTAQSEEAFDLDTITKHAQVHMW